jgi:hypothetical protein
MATNPEILQEKERSKEDRVPLGGRNAVQREIFRKLLKLGMGTNELELAKTYSKPVSDIIDNPENAEIRELIKQGTEDKTKYSEAADLTIRLLPNLPLGKAA